METLRESCEFHAQQLRGAGTPGYPCNLKWQTNARAINSVGFIDECVNRCHLLLTSSSCPGGWEAIKQGFMDPVQPFHKNEVMPIRKRGQLRIISCLSAVDQVVERVLLGGFVTAIKLAYPKSDVIVGIGFNDEKATEIGREIEDMLEPEDVLAGSDIRGWESSLQGIHIRSAYRDGIAAGITEDGYTCLKRAIDFIGQMRARPVYVLYVDGAYCFYYPNDEGNMVSGCLGTTTVNGMIRCQTQKDAGAKKSAAVGDDGLAASKPVDVDVLISRYNTLGFEARDVHIWRQPGESLTEFSFCSHRFFKHGGAWRCYLENADRALFKLLCRKVDPTQVEDYYREIMHHPECERYMSCANQFVEFHGGLEPTAETTEDE